MYKKFAPILLVVILASLAVAATFWRGQNQPALPLEQPIADAQNQVTQPQPTPDTSESLDPAPVSTADWQSFDEEAEGISNGVLGADFRFPSGWYTSNVVARIGGKIYFTDGGDFNVSGLSSGEIKSKIIFETILNECRLIVSVGLDKSPTASRVNTKQIELERNRCNNILSTMENQI